MGIPEFASPYVRYIGTMFSGMGNWISNHNVFRSGNMDAEVKDFEFGPIQTKWLEALESGEWKQANGCLKCSQADEGTGEPIEGKFAYCCLGVLAEIAGLEWAPRQEIRSGEADCILAGNPGFFFSDGDGATFSNGYLPLNFGETVGLRDDRGSLAKSLAMDNYRSYSLADLNDMRRFSFKEIAEFIRRNATKVFTHSA